MRGRLALIVITLTLNLVGLPVEAAPCPPGEGVTVVVDASTLGGDVSVACVTGEPSDGIDALQAAGHTITPTQAFSEFVCRIDGEPTAQTETCVNTPPASAFWSYWQATQGEDWETSQRSAFQSTPQIGEAEGWSFGSGDPPSIPPPNEVPTTTSLAIAVASTVGETPETITSTTQPPTTTSPATTATRAENDTAPGPWPTVIGVIAIGVLGGGAFIWTRTRGDDA